MLLITKVSPNWNNDWMNYLNEMERYPILQSLCGLAGTRNLAVCLEQATAEGGTATGGSRPTDALGKFPRRSEYTKLTPFRAWVVHLINDGVFDKFTADGSKLRDSGDIVSYRKDFFLSHKVEEITEIGIYTLPTDKQAVVVHASFNAG